MLMTEDLLAGPVLSAMTNCMQNRLDCRMYQRRYTSVILTMQNNSGTAGPLM